MLMLSRIFAALFAALAFVSLASAGPIYARHRLTPGQYQALFTQLTGDGWKLNYVSGYLVGNAQRYACIFEKVSHNPQIASHGLTSIGYQRQFDIATKTRGYTPVLVNGYTGPDGRDRYAAIWEKLPGPQNWVARHGMTSSGYQQEFDKWVGQGYRLKHVSGYRVNNQARYAAIWDKPTTPPTSWSARHGLTSAQYQQYFNQQAAAGYTLRVVSGYNVGGVDYYAAIFDKQPPHAWVARHRMTSSVYQSEFNKYASQGFKLKLVSGYEINQIDYYAALWYK